MSRIKRFLLLGAVLAVTQVGVGCCYNGPTLFPRLYGPAGGTCVTPLFSRPCLAGGVCAPVAAPVAGPVYGNGYAAPVFGGGYGGYAEAPVEYMGSSSAPCVGYGPSSGTTMPLVSYPAPVGSMVMTKSIPPTTATTTVPMPRVNTTVPATMPGSTSFIPHDSGLVPTVRPPQFTQLDGNNESKKMTLAGK